MIDHAYLMKLTEVQMRFSWQFILFYFARPCHYWFVISAAIWHLL